MLRSDLIQAHVITVKSVLSEQRKPGVTEIRTRAFVLLLHYIISGAAPERKKAASLCLRSQPESISKLLYFSCARKFCKIKQHRWRSEFAGSAAGAGDGCAGSISPGGSGQDLSPPLNCSCTTRLPDAQAPGKKKPNKPTSILTKSQASRQFPLT